MSNDNAYYLRKELLKQAEDILNRQYQTKIDEIKFNAHLKKDKKEVEYPKAPTSDDIVNEAKKLYKFVKTK